MRELTSHKLTGLNEALTITVMDEPGAGGACHEYRIHWGGTPGTRSAELRVVDLNFQRGPILENGVNGISGEALLAIVEDRLASFQAGAYACQENADALYHVQKAMEALQSRTRARLMRGVEGTSAK